MSESGRGIVINFATAQGIKSSSPRGMSHY